MTDQPPTPGTRKPATAPAPKQPDWAKGLKSIYDAVVDEPLPDDMLQLLASLDTANPHTDDDKGGRG